MIAVRVERLREALRRYGRHDRGCEGQPEGEPTCDEKINYWIGRHREACEQLADARAELAKAEPVLVAADRLREAYEAMIEGRDIGRLEDWSNG